jgi:hypothetical protein
MAPLLRFSGAVMLESERRTVRILAYSSGLFFIGLMLIHAV